MCELPTKFFPTFVSRVLLTLACADAETDKVYIYRIKKNGHFRAPGP